MRRALLLIALVTLAGAGVFIRTTSLAAPTSVPVQIGKVSLSKVGDWQGGALNGLLVSNNADGELRLADGSKQGSFISKVVRTDFSFNAVGAVWRAGVSQGTELKLEVRGGPTPNEAELGPWQVLAAGDARSQSDDGALAVESLPSFPIGTAFLQFRATLSATAANASPVLDEITLSYFDATDGPARSAGLPRVPAPYGPATLTAPPQIIQRDTWGAPPPTGPIVRQAPRGIILHQIGSGDLANVLPFLRALAAYDTEVLGWDDMPFHFILDSEGTIYAGRSGGPTATVARFSGGDAAIHVALIGGATPPAQQQSALASLLAWLGQAYDIPPTGQHIVAANGAARPNIVSHLDVAPETGDRSPELRALLDPLRRSADQATVRARWYFAEGNPFNFAERLAVLNFGSAPANVRFNLLRQPGPSVLRDATVPAGGRADLIVNELFNDTTDVPAIVESNAPVVAERYMDFGKDITSGPGVSQPSRVWYFAEGATDGANKTYLLLFNPQAAEAAATITYMNSEGKTAEQNVRIPSLQRSVVTVGDVLPGMGFGARVIATQPIVAERTMIFGPDSSDRTGGVHTGHGIVTLSRHWYFAEGTTQAPFQMNILVLNPNAQPANVAVTFLTDSGTSLTRKYAIPPQTRLAINVNEVVPNLGIGTTVVADRPVAAERAMYWSNSSDSTAIATNPGAGSATAGAIAPAFTWRFADGRTSDGFQEYLLLSNPSKNQARVAVEFVLADGKKVTQSVVMAGGSRYTVAVHQFYPGQAAIAATVRSTQPIVAERSLYPGAPGTAANRGGATALGVPEVAE